MSESRPEHRLSPSASTRQRSRAAAEGLPPPRRAIQQAERAWPNWRKLPADEQEGLVSAIERFKPNVERALRWQGRRPMARWLKDGKHLAWPAIRSGEAGTVTPICSFSGPPALRASVVEATDEEFRGQVHRPGRMAGGEDRTLIVRNAYADVEVRRELRAWLVSDEGQRRDRWPGRRGEGGVMAKKSDAPKFESEAALARRVLRLAGARERQPQPWR